MRCPQTKRPSSPPTYFPRILLALFALVNPRIPIIDDLLGTISGYASIICGIIGVILALKKD